ncbi:M16 family metallopeptidase [Allobaculum mucilyticum]|uniref:M16 family metallopeptidase n=1 Tax=Allobaculum mucilyticum TaxID=2834459 RepID=UPI001E5830A8|nr:pitrilysin family protein [Allobaculum mucilyticum]UNT95634.1 insulinase family protein [Allobaculum mucilyticum]
MPLKMKRRMKTLENGMRVILTEKPGYSRSLFMIGVPAGGTNQLDLQNGTVVEHPLGCAHYLEHKMFRYKGHDVTYDLAAVQAKSNAYTTYTDTCYYFWTNADPKKPLDLLIDFVQTLDLDQESVDKEKGIILSEYSQYEQDPEMRLIKETLTSLYSAHPLRYDILGKPDDIRNMREEDLREFYNTWYDPSHLALVGVTGRDIDEVMGWIEEKEKEYPSKSSCRSEKILPEEPYEVSRESLSLAMDVDLSYAAIGVKLDPVDKEPEETVREDYMLNLWLTGTISSINPEFQKWIDEKIIGSMCLAEGDLDRDHGYILIEAQTERPEEFFETISRVLDERRPLCKEAFESVWIREKASSIRLMDSFDGLAGQSVRQIFFGYDPLNDVDILNSITLEDLNAWIASQDFSRRVRTLIHPMDEEDPESEDDGSVEPEAEESLSA